MNKLIIAAASMLLATSAFADQMEVTMVEVEMTPIVKEAPKPVTAKKWDARFENYALENFGCCGQQ